MKLVKGTDRADRRAPNEPAPPVQAPSRPSWLGKGTKWGRESVREWDRLVPLLERNGLITHLDRGALVGLCEAWGRVWYYRRQLAQHGEVQMTETGYVTHLPWPSLYEKAWKDYARFCAMFGLSPADRTRVNAEKQDDSPRSRFAGFG